MDSWFLVFVFINIVPILNAGPEGDILFTTTDSIKLYNTGRAKNTTTISSGLSNTGSIDFDFETQMLFYVQNKRELHSMNLVTKEVKNILVLEKSADIEKVAVDWITKKIYFTDSRTSRIEVCKFDGSDHLVLSSRSTGLSNPQGVTISPLDGLLFFVRWGDMPQLASLNLDGTDLKVLVNTDIYMPSAITVDHVGKALLWFEPVMSTIEMIQMDGTKRRVFYKEAHDVFDMSVLVGVLYMSEFRTNSLTSCVLSNKTICQEELLIDDGHSHIRAYGRHYQPFVHSPCHNKNGGCSHLCLLKPNGFSCACPTGIMLLADNQTCATRMEKFVVFSSKTELRLISLETDHVVDQVLQHNTDQTYNALDYDPVKNDLFWTDNRLEDYGVTTGFIYRGSLNGSVLENVETVIPKGFTLPETVSVDWVARNLYWTCPQFNKIYVSKLDGSGSAVIIDTDLDEPRGIVVDPSNGRLYWSDWGQKPKIEAADLDGSNRIALVTKNLTWPNGIALDYRRSLLYWVDASHGSVEFYDILRGTRHEIEPKLRTPHPYSISIIGNFVYWTDWATRSLYQLNIETRERKILAVATYILGVKAIDLTFQYGHNSCQISNGGCSHFCFFKPINQVTCGCPDGFQLDVKRKTCNAITGQLIYSTQTKIIQLSLDSGHETGRQIILDNDITHLSTDSKSRRVFWVNNIPRAHKTRAIKSVVINDTKSETVIQTGFFGAVGGIDVDWICGNLYWTQANLNRIEVSRLDGRYRRMIYYTDDKVRLSLITVNPLIRKLYWLEGHATYSSLCSSELDGSSRTILTNITGHPNGLTVDLNDSRIFWITEKSSELIESINWDGTNRTVIATSLGTPMGLTIFQDRLYFCEQEKPHVAKSFVSSILKSTGSDKRTVVAEDSKQWFQSIATFYNGDQEGENLCERHNGGCQHLCFATSLNERICQCEMHYDLASDKTSCNGPEQFLLLNEDSNIYRVPLQNDLGELPIHIPTLPNISKMFFNIYNFATYWIDPLTNQINYVQNSTVRTVNLGVEDPKPDSFAIDFISNSLYWVDTTHHSINYVNLNDFSKFGVIFKNENYHPSALQIFPERGLLFFVNAHPLRKHNSINSITFNGVSKKEIRRTSVQPIHKLRLDVSDVTVDYKTEQLYWLNVPEKKIWSSDLDGGNVKTVMEFNKDTYDPISIAVHGSTLYWVDVEIKKRKEQLKKKSLITKPDESKRNRISYFGREYENVNTVIFVDITRRRQIHPCLNNGGCSHICHPVWLENDVREARCACPQGYIFKSGSSFDCEEHVISSCPNVCDGHCYSSDVSCKTLSKCKSLQIHGNCFCDHHEFKCPSSAKCVQLHALCNSVVDCLNGDDEIELVCARLKANKTSLVKASVTPQIAGTDLTSYTAGIISGAVLTSIIIVCLLYIICVHYHRKSKAGKKYKGDALNKESVENNENLPVIQLIQRPTSNKSTVFSEPTVYNGSKNHEYRYITGSSTNITGSFMVSLNPPPSVVSPSSVMSSNLTLDMDSVSRTGRDDYNFNYYDQSDIPAPPATPFYRPSDVDSIATYGTSDVMFLQNQNLKNSIADCSYCDTQHRTTRPNKPPSPGGAAPSLASSYLASRNSQNSFEPKHSQQLYTSSMSTSLNNPNRRLLPSLASNRSASISSLEVARELNEYDSYAPPPPSPGNELYTSENEMFSPDMNDFTEYQDDQEETLELDFLLSSDTAALEVCDDVDCGYF